MRTTAIAVTFALGTLAASGNVRAQSTDPTPTPTFSRDVAPIFFARCATCHRPGEIAPMSLLTYKDARPWARSIAQQVESGAMPPWHADPAVGEFANERRLSAAEKSTIARWVAAGAPEGDPKDLPDPPRDTDGWRIGQPDAVLSMQEDYPIPATGTVAYQYFEVPASFSEDRWITAWELRPGNRRVVHHVIVYLRPPAPATPAPSQTLAANAQRPQPLFTFADGMDLPAGQTGGPPLPENQRKRPGPNDRPRPRGISGSIGGYVPGNSMRVFREGMALRLPAGASLVFQMHYTPIGEATTDRSRIGLIFAKERPRVPLSTVALVNGSLHIPPGAADHRVDAEVTINRDIALYSLLPHTHMRGKRWLYEAVFPDGRKQAILSVPHYNFDWQHEYVFREPLRIPKGTVIHATAWYDNSSSNKWNPDPTADVWWGDQTWEEMMYTSLTYIAAAPPPSSQR